jgi:serine/threonine protein kinase
MSKLDVYFNKVIGEGAFSKVYVGKYKNEYVAVKIIHTDNIDTKVLNQYERELDIIRILQKNPHRNIPKYYTIKHDTAKNRIIIAMEWCKQGNLANKIKQGLTMEEVQNMYSQIIDGYNHLLSLNIIHRDIKGQNITITDTGIIKLIDFGLSKLVSTDMTCTFVGSPAYMSPERLNREEYGRDSDIWSLGILLYEMVYYVNPFKNCRNYHELKKRLNNGEPVYISSERTETVDGKNIAVPLDPRLVEYLKGCLHTDQLQRYNWNQVETLTWIDQNFNDCAGESIDTINNDIVNDIHDNMCNNIHDDSDSDDYHDTNAIFAMDGIDDTCDSDTNNTNINDNAISIPMYSEYIGNTKRTNDTKNIIGESPVVCYIDNNGDVNEEYEMLLKCMDDIINNDDSIDPNFIDNYDFIKNDRPNPNQLTTLTTSISQATKVTTKTAKKMVNGAIKSVNKFAKSYNII